jgi:hypothetical protein
MVAAGRSTCANITTDTVALEMLLNIRSMETILSRLLKGFRTINSRIAY